MSVLSIFTVGGAGYLLGIASALGAFLVVARIVWKDIR